MMFFNKKPKVEFLCRIDSALVQYPIIEASKLPPAWFKEATSNYAKNAVNFKSSKDSKVVKNIVKCSGIRKLIKTGWILQTYQDIHLKILDGEFSWSTPLNQETICGTPFVSWHAFDSFTNCPQLEGKTPILKINTPWMVKIPKGYNMLQMPVTYGDEDRFLTATGIYERAFGFYELNIQLIWQGGNGEFLIKAGTPIAHLVLVEDSEIKATIRACTSKEVELLKTIQELKLCRYQQNYSMIKASIKQLFKKDYK